MGSSSLDASCGANSALVGSFSRHICFVVSRRILWLFRGFSLISLLLGCSANSALVVLVIAPVLDWRLGSSLCVSVCCVGDRCRLVQPIVWFHGVAAPAVALPRLFLLVAPVLD